MRKEVINTFGEGLIMDLHPLTTPNNVLTNCLNGTIITYNGNEFVLQNDMGNGEVHTASLEKGYIPVGIKEHGGIIYVAAHNPISGKSQIGSFPSPQQLYEGDDLNITPISFDFSNFVVVNNSIPYIKLEYYKQKLFQSLDSGEVKTFHPGDKFIIVCDTIDTAIKEAIDQGVIKLRLGVINSSGSIDYIDDNNLKLYSNGLWLYENSNLLLEDILKSKELVQVFNAKSSGALVLIIEFKTFDTFNLIRKYSCDDSNVISVEFSGETTGIYKGSSKTNSDTIGLLQSGETTIQSTITKSGQFGKIPYKIMPVSPYGVLERMAKSGTIDFDAIRTNSEILGEWRFYVTDTYLKIGWGYDYYNLNENSDIGRISFTFINVTDSSNAVSASSLTGAYTYTIAKEYYNGSFEEIIPFNDLTIKRNWVYIVRIDRYVNGVKKTIGYRLVYTGNYFNNSYEEIQDFNSGLASGASRQEILLPLKNEISSTIQPTTILHELKANDSTVWETKNTLVPSDYIKEVASIDTNVDYRYNTRKTGTYNIEVIPSVNYDIQDGVYAGTPSQTLLSGFFSGTASFDSPDNSEIGFNNQSTLTSEISTIGGDQNLLGSLIYDSNKFTGTIKTSRNIIAANGPVKSITSEVEKLMPVYQSSLDANDKTKLFSFKEVGDTLYCVTGDRDYCAYNSRILQSNSHTEGSYKGTNGGAGQDDDGLRACLASMGDGIIGIFGGHDCDDASLKYSGLSYNSGAWYTSNGEIDSEDNFLLATWKDKEGTPYIINLGSQKTSSGDTNTASIIRLEMMIKCFLSQMLVAKQDARTANYVGPNSSEFTYHTAFNTRSTIHLGINNANQDEVVNFYLGDSKSIEEHMSLWVAAIPTLKNFLPICKIHKPSSLTTTIEYGDNIKFDNDSNILNCYTSAYSYYSTISPVTLTDTDRSKIFIGVRAGTNSDGSLILAKNSNGTYQTQSVDTQLVDWKGSSISLGYSLNSRFINSYSTDRMTGEIPAGFFNGVFINNIEIKSGSWTNSKDKKAPDMAYKIGFGTKSIFNYT